MKTTHPHRSGLWKLAHDIVYLDDSRVGGPHFQVCEVNRLADNWEANARLITAAPDLLDALKDELDALAIWIRATSDLDVLDGMAISISKIRAAIAKAEG